MCCKSYLAFIVFLLPFAAPTEVRNLSISSLSNDTALLVLWKDSASPNGVVTYTVRVTCYDLATSAVSFDQTYDASFGGDLRIEIPFDGGLEPFANYTVAAVASNSAGNSSESTDHFITPQGGKLSHTSIHTVCCWSW